MSGHCRTRMNSQFELFFFFFSVLMHIILNSFGVTAELLMLVLEIPGLKPRLFLLVFLSGEEINQ